MEWEVTGGSRGGAGISSKHALLAEVFEQRRVLVPEVKKQFDCPLFGLEKLGWCVF